MSKIYYYYNIFKFTTIGHMTYTKYDNIRLFHLSEYIRISVYMNNKNFETIDNVYSIKVNKNSIIVNNIFKLSLKDVKTVLINNDMIYGDKI